MHLHKFLSWVGDPPPPFSLFSPSYVPDGLIVSIYMEGYCELIYDELNW